MAFQGESSSEVCGDIWVSCMFSVETRNLLELNDHPNNPKKRLLKNLKKQKRQ